MADKLWEEMYRRDKYARERVIKAVRMLLPYLKPGDTVLDVGCFTQEAKKYLPSDIKYFGIDGKKYHKDTLEANLDYGFYPVPCSHAICLETLEHLVAPKYTVESIYKSLSLGGYLVLSLPNEANVLHRIRCLFGVSDPECFSGEGKHLHLPSLKQVNKFLLDERLQYHFEILKKQYYVSPTGVGSRIPWVGKILSLIPDAIHQLLADLFPSLFSRGFIFLCKHKSTASK